uniref:Peptidase S9 prolyl oligopeptidase catalytic domain-containing protein n=1 Tax=Zea mays TaxID=4577 RepID=B4FAG2_MAIZE|nr:unknown [Zea mays]
MVAVQKLTAESMLAAPRRGPAVPNPKGTLALYTVSTHSFEEGKTVTEARVMDLSVSHGKSEQLWEDDKITEALWIPGTDSQIVYLKDLEDQGFTQVKVADGGDVTKEHVLVKEIKAPINSLKLKALDDGSIVFAVSGQVADDGTLYNPKAVKKRSTGRVFDSNEIRIWTQLHAEYRYSIWSSKLVQDKKGNWQLAGDLVNLITASDLDAPFGQSDQTLAPAHNYDIASHGIVFSARSLKKGVRAFYACDGWYVAVDSYLAVPAAAPRRIETKADGSSVENVRFTPDGERMAFLYHDPKDWFNARLMMCTPDDLVPFDVFTDVIGVPEDDDSDPPTSFEFAGTGDEIIYSHQQAGGGLISHLKLQDGARRTQLTKLGSVAAFFPLVQGKWDRLLVTSSSFVDSSLYSIVTLRDQQPGHGASSAAIKDISSATKYGAKFGLDWDDMVEEFWYASAAGRPVQCWMIKPMGFDSTHKYPWILLPHGGPVSAWTDAWSTRWNPALFAEQGYVVILPNITGSVGFGKEFVRRIDNEWGGRAFADLLSLLDVLEKRPYLDQSKAVLAGASYGGYLVSWFFGDEVAEKFCGAVWHDGIFNLPFMELETDLLDPDASFAGPPYLWLNFANLDKSNPATPERLARWKHAPPTIVIHSEKDYRCPITEGLATFNTLLAQGVPARFLTFPDEGHWVLGAENSKVWHEVVLGWIDRCVRGEVKRGDKDW